MPDNNMISEETPAEILAGAALRARGKPVTIITQNGYQMQGEILQVGREWVQVRTATATQVVLLQAISTIITEENT